ncbi:MAG TPA: toluene hydroxylase [Streptosporangiaceae bacterium]|jgi:toluene monooxygenase system protein E
MTEQPTRKKRKQRTFSAFGDVRRMPSEYEIVTHGQNWTMRTARTAAFEQNPSSAPNLWFLTYRDRSPLRADDWDAFRDPDALTYKTYVTLQSDAETKTGGVLEEYAAAQADTRLTAGQRDLLGSLFTPSRYLVHGCQQIEAYIGYMAPSSYITNTAGFATADFLRRLTLTAYRTRELQIAHPGAGFGTDERRIWEQDDAWQPAREAIERALVAYDWGEAFTALNLVLAPTLDDVLLRQTGEISRADGDEETWLLLAYLQDDNDRRDRWSAALARYCVEQRPGNAAVLRRWIDKWAPIADAAAAGLGRLLETRPEHGRAAGAVATGAAEARNAFHERALGGAGETEADGRRAAT